MRRGSGVLTEVPDARLSMRRAPAPSRVRWELWRGSMKAWHTSAERARETGEPRVRPLTHTYAEPDDARRPQWPQRSSAVLATTHRHQVRRRLGTDVDLNSQPEVPRRRRKEENWEGWVSG